MKTNGGVGVVLVIILVAIALVAGILIGRGTVTVPGQAGDIINKAADKAGSYIPQQGGQ